MISTKLQNGIWAPSPSKPTPPPTTTYQQGMEHMHGSGSWITVSGRHQQSSIGSGLRRSVCKTWMHLGVFEYVTFPRSFYSFLPFLGWGPKSSLGLAEPSRVWQLKQLRNLRYSPQTPPSHQTWREMDVQEAVRSLKEPLGETGRGLNSQGT